MQPIWTLNARSHVMLEVIRDHFGVAAPKMRRQIQGMHRKVVEILSSKDIDYSQLRSALVPTLDRHEACFIFDSTEVESGSYGRDVFFRVLPLLEPRTTQSILDGDLGGEDKDQPWIFEMLRESIVLARSFEFKHSTLLFGVYINNLSDASLARLHEGLGQYPPYIGYIQCTYSSQAKTYLSLCMAKLCIKKGNTIILGHEADRPNSENINITHVPFEENNFKIVSLQADYFGIFLSYKIERPVFGSFAVDSEMALNAISDHVARLDGFTVLLDEAKHGYLINEKLGKLEKAGLANADREHIASLIKAKVNDSYIYNLQYLEEHDVMKFNLIVEVDRVDGHPTRLLTALEYIPENKTLRVITTH